METTTLREKFTDRLLELNNLVQPKDHARIAVNTDLNPRTVSKYLNGDIRNLEIAEVIIIECEKVLEAKQLA